MLIRSEIHYLQHDSQEGLCVRLIIHESFDCLFEGCEEVNGGDVVCKQIALDAH